MSEPKMIREDVAVRTVQRLFLGFTGMELSEATALDLLGIEEKVGREQIREERPGLSALSTSAAETH